MAWTQKDGELPVNDWTNEPEDTGVQPYLFTDVYWQHKKGNIPYRPKLRAIEPPNWGQWVIFDDIPTKTLYPAMEELNDYPIGLWRIDEDTEYVDDKPYKKDIPYREGFPEMCGIDDAPASLWIIIEGSSYNKDTPYKKDIPYRSSFPAMYKPRKERPPKYKKFPIEIDEYSCTIPIQVDYVQTVILDTYNVTVITEG